MRWSKATVSSFLMHVNEHGSVGMSPGHFLVIRLRVICLGLGHVEDDYK